MTFKTLYCCAVLLALLVTSQASRFRVDTSKSGLTGKQLVMGDWAEYVEVCTGQPSLTTELTHVCACQ